MTTTPQKPESAGNLRFFVLVNTWSFQNITKILAGSYCACAVNKFGWQDGWNSQEIWLDVAVVLDTSEAMGGDSIADVSKQNIKQKSWYNCFYETIFVGVCSLMWTTKAEYTQFLFFENNLSFSNIEFFRRLPSSNLCSALMIMTSS